MPASIWTSRCPRRSTSDRSWRHRTSSGRLDDRIATPTSTRRPVRQPWTTGRGRHIAELAARLAAIESGTRHRRHRRCAVHRRAVAADADGPARTAPARPARSSGPIGSSGTAGRRREPGGHPEDAPGDPAAVARAICLRLLTGAARPRAALATALRQRGIPDDVAAGCWTGSTEVGLIDDRAYAEAFVAAKHRDRALGVGGTAHRAATQGRRRRHRRRRGQHRRQRCRAGAGRGADRAPGRCGHGQWPGGGPSTAGGLARPAAGTRPRSPPRWSTRHWPPTERNRMTAGPDSGP